MSTERSVDKTNDQPVPEVPQGFQNFLERPHINPHRFPREWSPPEDPNKPNLPYVTGFTVQIHRHVPPKPSVQPSLHLAAEFLRSVPQSEAVVARPPPETSPPTQHEMAQLTITEPIDIGAAQGPQIVVCTITPLGEGGTETGEPFQAVAKIYDPLYYSFMSDLGHCPEDCALEADTDYSREGTAYDCLHASGQTGSFVPKYYGSWTYSLPITIRGKPQTRPVRLILIERLYGTVIEATRLWNNHDRRLGKDSYHLPEEYRLEVLARAMDGYIRLLRSGVEQGGFAGRNVMLVTPTDNHPAGPVELVGGFALPRVVLIDFNNSHVRDVSPDEAQDLPENPASIFWGATVWYDFPGWLPREWADGALLEKWLLERFNRPGQRELYLPVADYCLQGQ